MKGFQPQFGGETGKFRRDAVLSEGGVFRQGEELRGRFLLACLMFVFVLGMTINLGETMTVSAAETAPAGVQKLATIEGISQFSLPNGLQVLLVPDDSKPTVTVNMTVFVGSRHEGYGEAGMAHLLEHMVFKGTPDHPQIPKALQGRGAKFNGTTWVDRTNYFETLPATPENLEFALKLEADRLVNSFIKGEDLASEMTVVRNEFERGENSPSRILAQRMMAVAFEWHNYGKSTIGNRSDIERVPVEKLKEFYKRFYQPDNALVVVAGKFDEAKTLQMIVDAFGKIPRPARKLDLTYTEEPPQDGERHVTLRRVGEVSVVGVLYHVPSGTHPDFAPLEVLEGVLTTSPSGRLYKALVETRKASSIAGSAYGWHDPGVVRLMAEVNKDVPPESVLDTLLDVTEGVGKSEVTEKEVERSKVQLIKQRELSAADTSSIAVELSEWAAQGDWRLYFLHRDRIEAVTPAQVKAVAEKYFKQNNRTVGMFLPTEKSEKVDVPASPSLATLLKDYKGRDTGSLGESFDVSPENIEKRTTRLTLPSGIQAALLPKKTRGEVVELRVSLRYGTASSLAPYSTAAEYLPALLGRGTKKLNREDLNDELDRNFAQLRAMGVPGLATFSVQTKRKNLPRVLELLRQILREPALEATEFELLKQRQLAALQQSRTDPQSVGSRALLRKLTDYPATDVRYMPTIDEEIERVKALSIDHMKELYDQFLGGHFGQVSVVGDFDPQETQPALEKLFENWSSKQPYARIERGVPAHWAPMTEVIRIPEKANAVYLAGLVFSLRDDDPDYAALSLGNYILGAGALSSRLGDRIRQKEGLSYGVYSSLSSDPLDQRTTVTVTAICNPQNVEKVNKAVHEEFKKLIQDGPTPEEVTRAKQGFLERQRVSRTDDADLAQKLNLSLLTGRTMAYYENLEKQVEGLTPQEVMEVLRRRIDPSQFAVFEAGDIK